MNKEVSTTIAAIVLAGVGALVALVIYSNLERPPYRHAVPAVTKKLEPEPKPTETILFFAGDIMLSRNVAGETLKNGDFIYPFGLIGADISKADISFANLESPFLDQGPYAQQGLVFKAQPEAVRGLTFAGFDILSTANNHSFDQGKPGVEFTLRHLLENGIKPAGTGLDCHNGVTIEKNNIKFGFLAYSYSAYNDGGRVPDPLVCDWNDLAQVEKDIQALKPKVDFLIISSHMGAEYKRVPEEKNAVAARATIDAGADLFIGHHPHWVQTVEEYNGKYIFYSLGNFVFDQMWSQDTKEGLTLLATFEDAKLKQIELKPVVIDNFCCPRWANEEETKNILTKINLTDTFISVKN